MVGWGKWATAHEDVTPLAPPLETKGKVSIIMTQCGPIRFRETDREQAAVSSFKPTTIPQQFERLTRPGAFFKAKIIQVCNRDTYRKQEC